MDDTLERVVSDAIKEPLGELVTEIRAQRGATLRWQTVAAALGAILMTILGHWADGRYDTVRPADLKELVPYYAGSERMQTEIQHTRDDFRQFKDDVRAQCCPLGQRPTGDEDEFNYLTPLDAAIVTATEEPAK